MDELAAASKEIIARGSKSFSAAARLFSPEMRDSAAMLYAWCRHCDDVIDGQELGFASHGDSGNTPAERLAHLHERTRAAIAGRPGDEPVFRALCEVVSRHAIPERFPLELLEGFEMDVAGRRYETLEDVLLYCYHVAGVVGVMMAMVMGVRQPATLVRAADLGIAFQLTNIARDVADDAALGRVYLPGQWLDEFGIPRDAVEDAARGPAIAQVVARLLDAAEPYYASARTGVRDLPFRAAWAISTALGVYRDIGRGVRAKGARAWDTRVSTGKARKLWHVAAGSGRATAARSVERLRARPARPALWMKPGLGA